jgi:hypothetical protein
MIKPDQRLTALIAVPRQKTGRKKAPLALFYR